MELVTKEEGLTYSYIEGRYPINSARGNQYMLVLYDYDSKNILTELLKPHDYYPLPYNPVIWRHKTFPTKFALFVDYFCIKYNYPDHARHIVNTL